MYIAMKELVRLMIAFRVAIDGGKDSLSMSVKHKKYDIDSPGTLVLSSYVKCPDIYKKITPDIKKTGSCLYFIDLSSKSSEKRKMRMGGSIAYQVSSKFLGEVPDVECVKEMPSVVKVIHRLIKGKKITAYHDRSDGGLICCLLEMAFAGRVGLNIKTEKICKTQDETIEALFNEELGFVIEVPIEYIEEVKDSFSKIGFDKFVHI